MSSMSAPSTSSCRSEPPKEIHQAAEVKEQSPSSADIISVIDSLKKQVAVNRCVFIKKKVDDNRQKLSGITNYLYNLSKERRHSTVNDVDKNVDLLTKRLKDTLSVQNGIDANHGERDSNGSQEDSHVLSAAPLGPSFGVKNSVRPIKLQEVKRLPSYTTWIFLDRNQRMTEDQSVVGRRRIYYDQNGGEALICSDSEEEIIDDEEEKKEFGECEDYILRMTIEEIGVSEAVLDSLAQCFARRPGEVKARYEVILNKEKALGNKEVDMEDKSRIEDSFLDKDLGAAMDSFDNLFCRRCLVFDCKLHGCSQDLVYPSEKQFQWSAADEKVPCGTHCYQLALKSENVAAISSLMTDDFEKNSAPSLDCAEDQLSPTRKPIGSSIGRRGKSNLSGSTSCSARNVSESSESEIRSKQGIPSIHHSSSPRKTKLVGKCGIHKRNSKRVAERVLVCMRKRQKKMVTSDSESFLSGCLWPRDMKLRSNSRNENEDTTFSSKRKEKSQTDRKSRRKEAAIQGSNKLVVDKVNDEPCSEMIKDAPVTITDDLSRKKEFVDENVCKQELTGDLTWKTIELGLFKKGVEIFGRNSCLIARNLLNGMKTCAEVYWYMNSSENNLSYREGDGANHLLEGHSKVDCSDTVGNEPRRRSRFLRRRGKVRRLKYTWKSAGYHSIRKRITERKDQPCRQYNPCNCQSACGKQCTCLLNGTCCEKYCGCPKSCKNRFRGCHCAKSQCRSRQCPCFAADRECDPDVCRNCWVSCGDGTLGVPSQRGDNYECRNMKLLLKQQQRVLLGRSDVSGWGAFLKNSVCKHEYLGEYTGELISHREADKRGKIYDRENSSFLFNLNDQFVLDAYRKGDKLKFANHSPDPNCYAKVIMVAGDHRVGIFAKERINAGEELFYDYRYEPDRAPAWARKPESSNSKKEDGAPSSGRAKKLA